MLFDKTNLFEVWDKKVNPSLPRNKIFSDLYETLVLIRNPRYISKFKQKLASQQQQNTITYNKIFPSLHTLLLVPDQHQAPLHITDQLVPRQHPPFTNEFKIFKINTKFSSKSSHAFLQQHVWLHGHREQFASAAGVTPF